jgi:hypothetical protein
MAFIEGQAEGYDGIRMISKNKKLFSVIFGWCDPVIRSPVLGPTQRRHPVVMFLDSYEQLAFL